MPLPLRRPLAAAVLTLSGLLAHAQPAATAAPPAAAPSPVAAFSIEDLVQLALRHNPAIRAAEQVRAAASAGVTGAGALPNPRLEMLQGTNRARLAGGTGGSVSGWSVAQLLESPALREARLRGARSGEAGSAWQLAASRSELQAQVRLAAYELLLRTEEAEAASDALELLEQIRSRVKLRVDSGEAPRYEMIKADAEVINARAKFASAKVQVEQSMLGLVRLTAGQLPPRWRLVDTLDEVAAAPTLEQLLKELPTRNPELQLLRSDVQRRQAQLDEARAGRFPGVELRAGQTRDPEVRQNVLAASIQLPLLDRRAGPIAAAAAELERARVLLEGREHELAVQLEKAARELELARLQTEALGRGALPDAESALRVAQAAYRFGERGILDVLDAQRLVRSVRADLLEARYRLQAARVALETLAGRHAAADPRLAPQP